uniref:Uncharacterized protein n=1 Tax=Chromera velia CCMP2878 TaxID=1169474 RepID=A0A0G4G8T4_9ALVE|eukprot:Cvel_4327.t1-p1 / transcript=Cvel_4327.t1 / gene=Cvel_4327 / organism=Chromera_velia_CCMP2878 / gene_product=hypothetical protein / transcript_product=hypothetical protein / location=Cvel_scaffold187:98888-106833(-) / protein_length=1414 / sequence_SO=supercontig / SO=protein_coding / is_pseudo=false
MFALAYSNFSTLLLSSEVPKEKELCRRSPKGTRIFLLCVSVALTLCMQENIYGALYDMLNQNYQVHEDFRCVVLQSEDDLWRADPPFLNRFEKQVLEVGKAGGARDSRAHCVHIDTEVERLAEVCVSTAEEGVSTSPLKPRHLLPGFSSETTALMEDRIAVRVGETMKGPVAFEAIQQTAFDEVFRLATPEGILRVHGAPLRGSGPDDLAQSIVSRVREMPRRDLPAYLSALFRDDECVRSFGDRMEVACPRALGKETEGGAAQTPGQSPIVTKSALFAVSGGFLDLPEVSAQASPPPSLVRMRHLAAFSTESELERELGSFLADKGGRVGEPSGSSGVSDSQTDAEAHHLLILLCNPRSDLLAHCKNRVDAAVNEYMQLQRPTGTSEAQCTHQPTKHVVLLLLGARSSLTSPDYVHQFPLGGGWRQMHLESVTRESPPVESLLAPFAEIVEPGSGAFPFHEAIREIVLPCMWYMKYPQNLSAVRYVTETAEKIRESKFLCNEILWRACKKGEPELLQPAFRGSAAAASRGLDATSAFSSKTSANGPWWWSVVAGEGASGRPKMGDGETLHASLVNRIRERLRIPLAKTLFQLEEAGALGSVKALAGEPCEARLECLKRLWTQHARDHIDITKVPTPDRQEFFKVPVSLGHVRLPFSKLKTNLVVSGVERCLKELNQMQKQQQQQQYPQDVQNILSAARHRVHKSVGPGFEDLDSSQTPGAIGSEGGSRGARGARTAAFVREGGLQRWVDAVSSLFQRFPRFQQLSLSQAEQTQSFDDTPVVLSVLHRTVSLFIGDASGIHPAMEGAGGRKMSCVLASPLEALEVHLIETVLPMVKRIAELNRGGAWGAEKQVAGSSPPLGLKDWMECLLNAQFSTDVLREWSQLLFRSAILSAVQFGTLSALPSNLIDLGVGAEASPVPLFASLFSLAHPVDVRDLIVNVLDRLPMRRFNPQGFYRPQGECHGIALLACAGVELENEYYGDVTGGQRLLQALCRSIELVGVEDGEGEGFMGGFSDIGSIVGTLTVVGCHTQNGGSAGFIRTAGKVAAMATVVNAIEFAALGGGVLQRGEIASVWECPFFNWDVLMHPNGCPLGLKQRFVNGVDFSLQYFCGVVEKLQELGGESLADGEDERRPSRVFCDFSTLLSVAILRWFVGSLAAFVAPHVAGLLLEGAEEDRRNLEGNTEAVKLAESKFSHLSEFLRALNLDRLLALHDPKFPVVVHTLRLFFLRQLRLSLSRDTLRRTTALARGERRRPLAALTLNCLVTSGGVGGLSVMRDVFPFTLGRMKGDRVSRVDELTESLVLQVACALAMAEKLPRQSNGLLPFLSLVKTLLGDAAGEERGRDQPVAAAAAAAASSSAAVSTRPEGRGGRLRAGFAAVAGAFLPGSPIDESAQAIAAVKGNVTRYNCECGYL